MVEPEVESIIIFSLIKVRQYNLDLVINYSEEKLKFQVTYLPKYQVEIKNLNTNETDILDLSRRSPDYLEAIYDTQGNLKNPLLGVVAPVSDSNPINSKHYSQGHDLILTQRI